MQAASVLVDENDCVESAAMPPSSVERFQPNHPKHTKWYSQCVFHSPVVFLVTVRRLHLITGLFSHSEWLLLKHVFPAGRKKNFSHYWIRTNNFRSQTSLNHLINSQSLSNWIFIFEHSERSSSPSCCSICVCSNHYGNGQSKFAR